MTHSHSPFKYLFSSAVFSEENIQDVRKIIPNNFEIIPLERKHISEKDIHSSTIFAARMTAENYFSIIAYKKDEMIKWKVGFTLQNSSDFKENFTIEWLDWLHVIVDVETV